jgi:hypothetical protein
LACFLYVGSPTSKENDERLEAIDAICFRHHGHAKLHAWDHPEG